MRSNGPRLLLALTFVALAATLVIHVSPWVTKGFGYSYDGYNGAMWGLGARGAVEDPIGNRLGGVQPSGYRYANHPPLLVWTTAATGGLTDERPIALRAPALLASLAALVLLALLLRDAGFGVVEIAGGVAVAGTSAMFLTFGAMLDTPILSLPFGLAAIWAAQRAWQGRPPPTPVLIAAGALAALAGWQSLLAAVLATALTLISPSTAGRRAGRFLGAGTLAGLVVTLAWIAWVKGTLLALGEQATYRTGVDSTEWFRRQEVHLGDLYGPILLVIVAVGLLLALALRPEATPPTSDPADASNAADADTSAEPARHAWTGVRPLAGLLATVVVGYTLIFRQASAAHAYWTFWGVALLAVAAAALLHAIVRAAARLPRPAALAVQSIAVVGVVVLACSGASHRSSGDRSIQEGLGAVPVLAAVPRSSQPDEAAVVVRDVEPVLPWADFLTHGRARPVSPTDLAQLPPDTLVFLVANGEPSPDVRAAAVAVDGRYVLMRAGDYQRLVG